MIRWDHFDVKTNILVGDTGNLFRLAYIYIEGADTGTTASTYLEPGSGGTADALSFFHPYQLPMQFKVLFDRTWVLNQNSSNNMVHAEFSIPVNKITVYDPTATTVRSGQIYRLFASDSSVVPHVGMNINEIFWFSDL
jgi:hypothetical protein